MLLPSLMLASAWKPMAVAGSAANRRLFTEVACHGSFATLGMSLFSATFAAEPEPAVMLSNDEMAARVARKAELLRKQDRKFKADAKIVFGAEYQKGIRSSSDTTRRSEGSAFLLPADVGGVNLRAAVSADGKVIGK
eukprot:CAMPEP_0119341372 /NCGR_PEP_ID=MMETSP1333-20130426/102229_1 /TAXON_ID=418940 /ORGANISM="Scyphosphaera apsteinii, Strain RCC1455" /LENGTH=136 /DNA_ID=CAMNT_0007353317 /DNA_START=30 /DNA_END=440 /DNA_ORIENTATION=-